MRQGTTRSSKREQTAGQIKTLGVGRYLSHRLLIDVGCWALAFAPF